MTSTRIATAAILAALALTACGGSDVPTRTAEPVVTAPTAADSSTPPKAAPTTPPIGKVDAPEVVTAVGQERAQSAAETAERFTGVAMSRCTEDPADVLGGLKDLLTSDAYQEAQGKVGGVVLVIDAPMTERCVSATDIAVELAVDGPLVLATAHAEQTVTALRDGVPADLHVERTYTLRMQPTSDAGWVVTALTTTDPKITAVEG